MCAISVQGIGFYFGEYRQGHFFEDPSEVFSYEVGLAARELGPDYRLMVVGQPVLRSADGNFGYLDQNIEKMDFNKITPETLAALPLVKGFLFAAIPLRRVDLEKIAKWFPGGKWNSVPNRFRPDEISYYTYLVKPEIVKSLKPITPPTFDPYQQVIESPDGRFSAKLRKDWGDQNDKPVIEVWDQKGSLLWKVPYQYPEVTPYSRMMILQWSPDSTEVYFYYPYSNNLWYTIFNGSDLQSLNVNTGEVKDIVAGCCVDFDFSPDMKKVAYTSENKAGILDLVTGQDKRVDILPHAFEQSGRIFISPSKEKVVFQTLSYFTGTSIFLDATTMDQKIIMSDYLISDYEFDGWSSDEKPRYRKGDEVITIDLDTLSQTTIGTVTPQP